MIENIDIFDHERFMKEALEEAEEAGKRGDLPVGAVIIHNQQIISRGSNRTKTSDSQVAHAEIDAIHKCTSFFNENATDCIIYTTVEPCIMCLSTIVMANIRSVVYAAKDHYMDMDTFIHANPYIKKRIHHYKDGVLEGESHRLLNKYSPFMAEIVINGRKPI